MRKPVTEVDCSFLYQGVLCDHKRRYFGGQESMEIPYCPIAIGRKPEGSCLVQDGKIGAVSDLEYRTNNELRRMEAYARRQLNTWLERTKAVCGELRKRSLPVSPIVPNPNVSERVKTCATCEAEAKRSKWQRVLDALLS